jgi:RimJ/RimL family protein N-acetyltransferase
MINFVPINIYDNFHLAILLSWRNNPDIFKFFLKQTDIIQWKQHFQFWISRSNRFDYFIIYDNRPIGHIAIDYNLGLNEISIMIAEVGLWGNGLATHALKEFIQKLTEEGMGFFTARISDQNVASVRLFNKCGFIFFSVIDDLPGWSVYKKTNI